MIKLLFTSMVVISLTGCASIKEMVPSFSDVNQSSKIIDVRQSVAQLNCKESHAPQVKVIKDNLQWFVMYSESKGWRQNDVIKLVKPIQDTVDDFYKRSIDKQGTESYCEIKKKIMTTQTDKAASAILGRF
jgi:hypothetical protein